MDIYSATWRVAVESAGIWPSVLDLGPGQSFYVLNYHRSDGQDRVLTAHGTTCLFGDLDTLNAFITGPHADLNDEVHLALEVLSSLSPEGLPPEHYPHNMLEQAAEWITGGEMLTSEEQVGLLLDTLGFLNDWHDSLAESGMPGEWPRVLDDTAELLTDVVLTHQITTLELAQRLKSLRLKPVLTEEITRLLNWRPV